MSDERTANPGRRGLYRVSPDADAGIAVNLLFQGASWPNGEIIDATARGIGLVFPTANAPAIPIADTVTLVVTSGQLTAPLSVDASVANRIETNVETRRYGLQFTDTIHTTASALNRLFNRRRHFRASADPANPVLVTIQSADSSSAAVSGKALMADISCGGIGILVDTQTERSLSTAQSARVVFQLPDVSGPMESVARIRARSIREGQVHLGLEFDSQARSFASMEQRIQKYVSHRQQQELATKVKV